MRHKHEPAGSGQELVADFQSAFVSSATIEAAKFEAARSEDELVNELSAISSGEYLNPGTLDADAKTRMTHNSLDAHIKKVQARQLESMNASQLAQLDLKDNSLYKGRKIQVKILPPHNDIVESIWFNKYSGYRSGTVKKGKITGIIDQVMLDKNTLILKPTKSAGLFNNELQNYVVYVIDPTTLLPMVEFTLL